MSELPSLDPAELLARARDATGLEVFDDPSPLEPLEVLTRALLSEARLNEGGRYYWSARLLGILMTRLRARDWFQRHPQILDEHIAAPVIILGLTRTGTTLLHRLMASDARFSSAAFWEARFPVPTLDDMSGTRRMAAAKAEIDAMLAANPELASIHPFDALGADEDILILDQTLLSNTAETLAHVPSYYAWLRQQDLRPAYRFWYRMLQLLQWQKRQRGVPGERWVLKTPMHLAHVDHILDLLPDAVFVQTHRDPLTTLPSYASMIQGLWKGVSDESDPLEAARESSATLEHDLARCIEVRDTLPPGKFIDVDFQDTVSDPVGVVERIYRHIDMPMTQLARMQIGAYLKAHPREGRPKHTYTLEQFGFTAEEIRSRFREYRARHIL
jgi:Sulfotransferase family